jgi:hypothetical protein
MITTKMPNIPELSQQNCPLIRILKHQNAHHSNPEQPKLPSVAKPKTPESPLVHTESQKCPSYRNSSSKCSLHLITEVSHILKLIRQNSLHPEPEIPNLELPFYKFHKALVPWMCAIKMLPRIDKPTSTQLWLFKSHYPRFTANCYWFA